MIKNLVFDLSEVLINGALDFPKVLQEDYYVPAEWTSRRWQETNDYFCDAMRGVHSENKFWVKFLQDETYSDRLDLAVVKAAIRKNMSQKVWYMDEVLKSLAIRRPDIRLILLSDHIDTLADFAMHRHPFIKRYFKGHIHFSFDNNLRQIKMDPGTFEKLAVIEEIIPQETILIDDFSINAEVAENAGYYTIVFTSASDTIEQLGEYDINI